MKIKSFLRIPMTTGLSLLAVFVGIVLGVTASKGQEWGEQATLLTANLTPFNQVPSVLAPSSGHFEAQVNPDGTIPFALSYANMSSAVVQAHIHFGASQTNGGVIVFLCGGAKPACPASGTINGTITAADVSVLPATNGDSVIPQGIQPGDFAGLIRAIQSGDTYVNVHTTNFPNGEIRGEVRVR